MIRRAFAIAAVLGPLLGISCTGTLPADAPCSGSSECETGLACLYDLGSGCAASGHCVVASSDCSGPSDDAGLSLCGCNGAPLDLSCIPGTFALPQRTATGMACLTDGGQDAGDGGD